MTSVVCRPCVWMEGAALLTASIRRVAQEFLLKSEAAFRSHLVWASAPPEHQQQAIEVTLWATLQKL